MTDDCRDSTVIAASEPCGVVVIDKPAGMTSFDVVARMRRIYNTRRIGHTGTLDPDATGVLVILVGRAAKAAEYITAGIKVYDAVLRLGMTTSTEDVSGEVLTRSDSIPPAPDVIAAAKSFLGDYMQTPPMYSALKRDGKKLVDLARRGITVAREPRPVKIYSIAVSPCENDDAGRDYSVSVACSSGTYIRTLCADIGAALGCGGCMASLRRTETCGFSIADAYTIEEAATSPQKCLLPTDSLFSRIPAVYLTGESLKHIKNGVSVPLPDDFISSDAPEIPVAANDTDTDSSNVRLYGDGEFFGLGERAGGMVRCVKFFIL